MPAIRIATLAFAALALAGCASPALDVRITADPNADPAASKTYVFVSPDPKDSGTLTDPAARGRIAEMIAAQLAAKGYRQAAPGQAPDLHVNFVGNTSPEQRVLMEGPGRGYYGYGWRQDFGGIDTYQYRKGTLVVDLVDPKRKELVWRARVSGALTENPSETNWTRVEQALASAFESLPPSR